jgi:hypothetical protein
MLQEKSPAPVVQEPYPATPDAFIERHGIAPLATAPIGDVALAKLGAYGSLLTLLILRGAEQ